MALEDSGSGVSIDEISESDTYHIKKLGKEILSNSRALIEWIVFKNKHKYKKYMKCLIISGNLIKGNIYEIILNYYLKDKINCLDRFLEFSKYYIQLRYNDFISFYRELSKRLDRTSKTVINKEIEEFVENNRNRNIKNLTFRKRRNTSSMVFMKMNDNIIKLHYKKIAKSLTLIEYSLFEDTKIDEFLKNKLKHMNDRYNKINFWIPSVILTSKDKFGMTKRFLNVCRELEKMNNFNSLSQIFFGLEKPCLSRLKLINQLDNKYIAYYNHLTKLFDPSGNYCNYRKAINNVDRVAIPIVPILLKDITFILEGNATYIDESINLKKITLLGKYLEKYYIRFKHKHFTFEFNEDDISNITCFNNIISLSEDVLWKLSRKILPLSVDRNNSSPRTRSTEFLFIHIIRKNMKEWSSKDVEFWMTFYNNIQNDELIKAVLNRKLSGFELYNLTYDGLKQFGIKDNIIKNFGRQFLKEIYLFHNYNEKLNSKKVMEWENIDVMFWLKSIGMAMYLEAFLRHMINGRRLLNLTNKGLELMGIDRINHRMMILNNIRQINSCDKYVRIWDENDVRSFFRNIEHNIDVSSLIHNNKINGKKLLELTDKDLKRMGILDRKSRKSLLWLISRIKLYGYSDKERLFSKGFDNWGIDEIKEWLFILDKIKYVDLFKRENIDMKDLLYLSEDDLCDIFTSYIDKKDIDIFIKDIKIIQEYNRCLYNKAL